MWQSTPSPPLDAESTFAIDRHAQRSPSNGRAAAVPGVSRLVIEESVAQVFGVGLAELDQPTRGRAPAAEARQVAMYLAHTALGITMREVGRLFARDRTTVAHACAVIEDRRDEPGFDRVLELLEWTVVALLSRRGGAMITL